MRDHEDMRRAFLESKGIEEPSSLEAKPLTDIFKASPIGIYIARDGKFCFVNPQFEVISGYGSDELIGEESLQIVHPEDRESVRRKAVEMLKGGPNHHFEYRAIAKDGEIRWIIEAVSSVNYEGRRATLGYFMDDTARQLTKEALSISEEKFKKAFRSSPDWFVISTLKDGLYLDVNDAFLKTTGYSREEVLGQSSIEIGIWVEPLEREDIVDVLSSKGAVRNREVHFRMKSGDIRVALWSAEVIEYGGEKCILALARDITEQKMAEKERLQKEKMQGVLETAGAACHELNQPLQFISFLLNEITGEYPDSDAVKELNRQYEKLREIMRKLENLTTYQTKSYFRDSRIVDIDMDDGTSVRIPGSR